MVIYNVTLSVEESITKEWLDWMRTTHIPEVMGCGFFSKAQITRVITQTDNTNSFAISYTCASMKELHQYQINFFDKMQQKHIDLYGDKAIAFRTIMEVIEEF